MSDRHEAEIQQHATQPPEGRDRASQTVVMLRHHLPAILEGRPVMLAYLYGSAATGHTTPFSDVDIALVLVPDCGLSPYQRFVAELQIATEIEQRCGIPNADVRSIDHAPLRVQGQVLTHGILLYSRDVRFRVEFEVYTRKRYFDFQPVLKMMRDAYFARLEADLKARELHGGPGDD